MDEAIKEGKLPGVRISGRSWNDESSATIVELKTPEQVINKMNEIILNFPMLTEEVYRPNILHSNNVFWIYGGCLKYFHFPWNWKPDS